ncbi:hypothetical protein Mro03_65690 [Microbispora rosea subsp. rosea]|jgi:hypothetical protein|nr:hypothetical protein Mro03_65690 [Microbispora rosea subsp. rosea]
MVPNPDSRLSARGFRGGSGLSDEGDDDGFEHAETANRRRAAEEIVTTQARMVTPRMLPARRWSFPAARWGIT